MTIFKRTENRIRAGQLKKKTRNPKDEAIDVRVMSSKVVSVAGQVYDAEVAGYKPGDVIRASNDRTKADARYRSVIANNGDALTSGIVQKMIADALSNFANTNNWTDNVNSVIPPADTSNNAPKLTVTPEDNILVSGNIGDDYTVYSLEYTLTNDGTTSINWLISHFADWVDISSTSGTLAASATTTTTVSINSSASSLGSGERIDFIVFNAEVV